MTRKRYPPHAAAWFARASDAQVTRTMATSSLRWLVFHVREARRNNGHAARLAWLSAFRRAEMRAEYES